MAQLVIGRELPNLKITLGNDVKPAEESAEEGEVFENEAEVVSENIADPGKEEKQNVEIVRKWISPILMEASKDTGPGKPSGSSKFVYKMLKRPKIYENKGGAFITGLDLSSEVVQKKLEERAKRFGLEGRPKNQITQAEIDALYESLEVHSDQRKVPAPKTKGIRLDAIHVRGVEDMSTNDVFDYFKEYGPSSVEWINDYSCNVVWLDEVSAARALLGLSRVVVVRKKNASSATDLQKMDTNLKENEAEPDGEEVILMSEESSDDEDSDQPLTEAQPAQKEKPTEDSNSMEVDPVPESEPKEQKGSVDASNVEVPVPPGHWRLGIPHTKTKALLLRFASKDDKKLPGAEKRSQYYQKYGNPNYGGLKGLISKSRKRKFQVTRQRQVTEKSYENEKQTSSHTSAKSESSSDEEEKKTADKGRSRTKQLRMRMYADDEEKKIAKRIEAMKRKRYHQPSYSSSSRQRSIYDRLGKSNFTVSVPHESDSEDTVSSKNSCDTEEVDSHHAKPKKEKLSRFNVWTRLAESMAEESELYDAFSSDYFGYYRKERDLRNKLHSSASQRTNVVDSEIPRHGDLRSKLEKMRKDHKTPKHQSPLLIQVSNKSDESDS